VRVTVPITLSVAVQGGAGMVVLAIIGMLLHGDLMTSGMLDRIIASYVQRLSEKDEQIRLWRDAHDTVKKTNDALITSMYQSLEIGKTTMGVVGAISTTPPAPTGGHSDPTVVA
jgi:hypothetical protein